MTGLVDGVSVAHAVPGFVPAGQQGVSAGEALAANSQRFKFGVEPGERVAAASAGAGAGVVEVGLAGGEMLPEAVVLLARCLQAQQCGLDIAQGSDDLLPVVGFRRLGFGASNALAGGVTSAVEEGGL